MRRLYTRIYLHFLVVLVVVGVATGTVLATGWRGAFFKLWAERLATHSAELIAEQPTNAARQRLVAHLANSFGVDITVRAGDGSVTMSAGKELPAVGDDERRELRDGSSVFGHGRGWFAAAPIGGKPGFVLELSPARRFGSPSLMRPIAIAALVLLIVGVATAPLARRISRPVERLTEAARRIGAGDLAHRVQIFRPRRHRLRKPPDEIEELTRAFNDMAERIEVLVRTQKELLANVSHELRSPLARVRVALELLPHDERSVARVNDLESDISELDRLIEDVLTMSRLDSTGLPAHLERVDLHGICRQLVERSKHDPAVAGREVRIAEGPGIEADVDGALIKRSVWNLIENAAKYGAPPITVGVAVRDDVVELSVSDAGAGIAAVDRERVFQPFFRATRGATDGRGYGLGLALARRVAEVHGGSIRAEPSSITSDGVEHGCAIRLRIPLRIA